MCAALGAHKGSVALECAWRIWMLTQIRVQCHALALLLFFSLTSADHIIMVRQ